MADPVSESSRASRVLGTDLSHMAAIQYRCTVLLHGSAADWLFVGHVRQQTNKAGTHHSLAHSPLVQCGGAGTAPRQDAPFTIDESAERFEVFVVDVDRAHHAARSELAAHLLLFQPGATLAEFLQI